MKKLLLILAVAILFSETPAYLELEKIEVSNIANRLVAVKAI